MEPLIESNRQLWNEWTALHLTPDADYQPLIERFKAGETTLDPIELEEVGEVAGKSMLHLQCHFGLGTLSWARRGAAVTGVDFSEASIQQAQRFSADYQIQSEFICSDLYDLPSVLDRKFDVVFTSSGVLYWLPDIRRWAGLVAHFLKPGGIFYIYEWHPYRRVMFPVRVDGSGTEVRFHYFSSEPVRVVERGSYSLPTADSFHTAHYWVHGVGEVVSALCSAGLKIEFLHEFPKIYENFPLYIKNPSGEYEMHLVHDWAVPNHFSIRAVALG